MVLSNNPSRIDKISYPLCSSFHPTLLDGQLCYKMQVNTSSAEGKKNQLMLLLDYNEDRSIYASNPTDVNFMQSIGMLGILGIRHTDSLSMDGSVNIQRKEAKVHIDTLSSFKGFGGGAYKMTVVKKMTSTDAFLNMAPEVKKCEVESFEQCRTQRLSSECNCVHSAIASDQVKYLLKLR